jgi:hypothetical protein
MSTSVPDDTTATDAAENPILMSDGPTTPIAADVKKSPAVTRAKRQRQDSFVIPTEMDYETCVWKDYSVPQLKEICKLYKLRRSCPKNDLIANIIHYFQECKAARKVQRAWRCYLLRIVQKLRGPGAFHRDLCVNSTDFSTLEELSDVELVNFFSFVDEDQHVYGFDVNSLLHLYNAKEAGEPWLNPYNRKRISKTVYRQIKRYVKLSQLLKLGIQIDAELEKPELKLRGRTAHATYDDVDEADQDQRALRLFYHIDSLGNYTQASWFTNLSSEQLRRCLIELYEIWRHRLQLTDQIRRQIIPAHLDPHFRPSAVLYLQDVMLREYVLRVVEIMVYSGVDRDAQMLGATYVLGALTQVSVDAARALPWLYDAMSPYTHGRR